MQVVVGCLYTMSDALVVVILELFTGFLLAAG